MKAPRIVRILHAYLVFLPYRGLFGAWRLACGLVPE